MWQRFWTDFSKAMLITDPLAYGMYMAWALEGSGEEDSALTPPRGQVREPFGSALGRILTPSPPTGR
jgi:hypothetical protein